MKTFARLSVLLAFLLLLLPTEIPAQESQFGFMFTKDPLNPVFRGGGAGTWDLTVLAPWVLFNSDAGRYEMWYTGLLNGRANGIGFAVSDDGYIWERKSPLPVLSPTPGSWDSLSVVGASVVRENGLYKMWYTGGSSTRPTGFPHFIGYAVSNNGIDWIKSAGPVLGPGTQPWEAMSVAYCCVIPSEGGYTMFYTGETSNNARIGRAFSADGNSWVRDTISNPVLTGGPSGSWDGNAYLPRVVTDGQLMYMFYTAERVPRGGTPGIGVARSGDGGRTWEKDSLNPILGPGASGSWDMNGVELGAIMFEGGQARMWFDGEKYFPAFSASLGYAAGPWPMSPLPTVPFGISPVNGSWDVVPPAVALVWSKCVPGVLQYRVEVASDSVFQFVLLDSLVSDTACTLSSLETLRSYWWRVRARNDEGWGGACHPMSFRTIEVGVEDDGTQPHQVSLRQNYPNPFNPVTTIIYQLPGAAEVRLSVHDMLGREVRLLVSERMAAGTYTVEFDGAGLASGAYAYRLSVHIPGPVGGKGSGTGIGTHVQSRTMLLLR